MMQQYKWFTFIIFAAVLLAAVSCSKSSEKSDDSLNTTSSLKKIKLGESKVIRVEIADTQEKRSRGLMYRRNLADNEGMLFVFDTPGYHSFYMKNTYIPLSIAFISEELKIVKITQMKPLDERTLHYPPSPVKYALEMNKDWFKKNGIRLGDRLSLDP